MANLTPFAGHGRAPPVRCALVGKPNHYFVNQCLIETTRLMDIVSLCLVQFVLLE